ncbi:hypothetical protein K470DRAFT_82354 [Piedraia hortae CBS 480.64]|uniref:Uncharacterized protein n=1 Tax=Piedraia hortae CBS 480.64 TaxID=1314780 RepID=A0A6A7C8K3_9PEZI|nr:hypothetical protein K470DRAFT_82354 [Piedraia hortae CBS 480.64]
MTSDKDSRRPRLRGLFSNKKDKKQSSASRGPGDRRPVDSAHGSNNIPGLISADDSRTNSDAIRKLSVTDTSVDSDAGTSDGRQRVMSSATSGSSLLRQPTLSDTMDDTTDLTWSQSSTTQDLVDNRGQTSPTQTNFSYPHRGDARFARSTSSVARPTTAYNGSRRNTLEKEALPANNKSIGAVAASQCSGRSMEGKPDRQNTVRLHDNLRAVRYPPRPQQQYPWAQSHAPPDPLYHPSYIEGPAKPYGTPGTEQDPKGSRRSFSGKQRKSNR